MKKLLPIVMISLISCTSPTNKTCDCLRQATNNAILEGNELSEDDLIGLCVESQEKLRALPLEEKNIIAKCMDSALNNIPIKRLFPEKNQRELPPIKDSKEIESTIITFKNRYNGDQAVLDRAGYYFAKRPMTGRLLVSKMERDLTTEEIIIKDDKKIEVIGMLVEGDNVNKTIQVRLRMSFEAMTDIKERTHIPLGEDEYNQVIDFHGVCSQFSSTVGGDYSITVDVDKYKLINKNESKITVQSPAMKDTVVETHESNVSQATQSIGAVISDKAYFYREADLSTQRKGYLIKGQSITTGEIKGDFIYCIYQTDKGKTEGWMLRDDIQF